MDDIAFNYKCTGQNEIGIAYAPLKVNGDVILAALQGSTALRTAVVQPASTGDTGDAFGLIEAGIPTIGYIAMPNYLCAAPPNGCIEKLSSELMYSQIQVFAKIIHKMDGMSIAQLRGQQLQTAREA